jgi:aspartate racemase
MKNRGAQNATPMFGLVTGLGMGAGLFYYRSLVNAHLTRSSSQRILMVHADVRCVMGHAAAHEKQLLATYLAGLLRQLADGGAQIGTIPAFSPQICAQELEEMTPLPLVSLLDVIVAESSAVNFNVSRSSERASPWKQSCLGDSGMWTS